LCFVVRRLIFSYVYFICHSGLEDFMAVVHSVAKILMVSVAGAALVCAVATPAKAGFDWTPPAAKAAAPTASAPQEAPEQVDPNLLTPEPDASAPVMPVEGAMLKPGDNLPAPGEPVRDIPPAPAQAPAPTPVAAAEPVPVPPAPVVTAAPPSNAEPAPHYRHLSRAESHAQYESGHTKQPSGMKTISSRETGAAPVPPAPEPAKEPVWNPEPQPLAAETVTDAPAQTFDTIPLQGFGKDISLAIALSQIVPPSYAYKFADGVNPGQKVSWNGGKPWTQVLSDVLVANDLEVVIQGNVVKVQMPRSGSAAYAPAPASTSSIASSSHSETKVARLAPAATATDDSGDLPVPTGKPMAVTSDIDASEAQAVEASEKQAMDTAEQPVAVVAEKDAKAPVISTNSSRRWEATPGKTLRETLESWSSTAGAELEWMSPYDFPVDHSFVYEGKFSEAVDSLLSLYSREQQRPRGRLYPNLPDGPSVLMVN